MKKIKLFLVIVILSTLLIGIPVNIKGNAIITGQRTTSPESSQDSEVQVPTVENIDYENGTRETIIDYHNGTIDIIRETLVLKKSELTFEMETLDQPQSVDIPTSTEECTDWITKSISGILTKHIMMGFTYTIVKYSKTYVDWSSLLLYVKAGVEIDIGFGLRLPFRIDIEYPESMTVGKEYTWYATAVPYDKDEAEFDEFYCKFITYAWLKVGIPFVTGSWSFGPPTIDKSKSFEPPLGAGTSFPIGNIDISIWNLELPILGRIISLDLVLTPKITSQKFTANVNSEGDGQVIGPNLIEWTSKNQKKSFTVLAGDYEDDTDLAKIVFDDFRYYFTDFKLDIGFEVDFCGAINVFVPDIYIKLLTANLDDILPTLYLQIHDGYDNFIAIDVFVKKFNVELIITPLSQNVVPGDTILYDILIINLGNVVDTFILSLTGLDPPWIEFSESIVTLGCDTSTNNKHVTLSITPERHYSTSPIDYPFSITATSQGADSEGLSVSDTEDANVHVLPFYELDLSVSPTTTSIKPDETGEFELDVQNLGNVLDSFDLDFYAIDFNGLYRVYPTIIQGDWVNIIPSTILDISPGLIGNSLLTIDAPYDWAGMEDATYEFNIKATSLGDSLATDSESASITIEATLESRLYYINLELHWLKDMVSSSTIKQSVKDGLLDKLEAAIYKKEQAHQSVFDGRLNLVDNKLEACKNIMEAFRRLVAAQRNKYIPLDFADILTTMASEIIMDIEDTIDYLLTSILGVNTMVTTSNSLHIGSSYNPTYILTGIVQNIELFGIVMVFLKKTKPILN